MHLLTVLAAGVRGAELGTAELYRRGTATRANWFRDFEGTAQVADGASLDLDSYGRVTAYVNELVRVLVKDAAGVTVLDVTAGKVAGGVEYQGQGFTGTDYTTGIQAAGKPTTVQAIFDLWKDQNDTTDWQVKVGTTTRTLPAWMSGLAGLFVNVKDEVYGAVGDNVADDTAAVQAAFTAADNAGGIVVIPPGTYKITSLLTLGPGASVMGFGVDSILNMQHASNSLLSVTGGGALDAQFIENLTLANGQNNTGTLLSLASSTRLLMRNCQLGLSTTSVGSQLVSIASNAYVTRAVFEDCVFYPGGSSTQAVNMADQAMGITLTRCRFIAPASYSPTNGMVYGTFMTLADCGFINNAAAAGTFSCFKANTTSMGVRVKSCDFSAGGGATITAIELGTYTSSAVFLEDNCSFGAAVTAYKYVCAAASKGADVRLGSRTTRRYTLTSDAVGQELPTDQYGVIILVRSTNANQTPVGLMPPEGSTGCIIVRNASGGNIAAEDPDVPLFGFSSAAINNTLSVGWWYQALIVNATAYMIATIDAKGLGSP